MTETGGGARDNEQYARRHRRQHHGRHLQLWRGGRTGARPRPTAQRHPDPHLRRLLHQQHRLDDHQPGRRLQRRGVAPRHGGADRPDQLRVQPQRHGPGDRHLDNVAALNFVTPDTATRGQERQRRGRSHGPVLDDLRVLSIANGATFWIRWNDQTPRAPTTAWRSTISRSRRKAEPSPFPAWARPAESSHGRQCYHPPVLVTPGSTSTGYRSNLQSLIDRRQFLLQPGHGQRQYVLRPLCGAGSHGRRHISAACTVTDT